MKLVKKLDLLCLILFSLFLIAETGFCEDDTLILTSEGNVGVGTHTPQSKLHVNGNLQVDEVILKNCSNTNGETATNGTLARNSWGDLVIGKNHTWVQVAAPVGTIIMWPTDTPPEGYLECKGSHIRRSSYPELYSVLDSRYGYHVESRTIKRVFPRRKKTVLTYYFALPDLRGEFVRGWDHGRGVDSGRSLGSSQSDAIRSHAHRTDGSNGGSRHAVLNDADGPFDYGSITSSPDDMNFIDQSQTGTFGSRETRPRNMAVMFCIKVK